MTIAPALLADVEYLKLVMAIVAMAIFAINHLLAGMKKQPPKPMRKPAVPDVPASPGRTELNAELSEFLRRAAEKRAAEGRPGAPVPASSPMPQRVRKRKKPAPEPPALSPDLLKEEDSIANRRVVSRLESRPLDERGRGLTSLDKTDEIAAHLEHAFNRPVGQLGHLSTGVSADRPQPEAAAENVSSAAAQLAALIRDPQSLREAIVLNEILMRPTDRW